VASSAAPSAAAAASSEAAPVPQGPVAHLPLNAVWADEKAAMRHQIQQLQSRIDDERAERLAAHQQLQTNNERIQSEVVELKHHVSTMTLRQEHTMTAIDKLTGVVGTLQSESKSTNDMVTRMYDLLEMNKGKTDSSPRWA
jgi:predicted  nucleic acid-binding Zn-ribbon protein